MLNRFSLAPALLILLSSCGPSIATTGSDAAGFDLVVAATTDMHGRVRGWNYESNRIDPLRGLSRAATIVDSLRRAASGHVVLIDGGDLLQGNSFTYVAARVASADTLNPVVSAMNAMHYDAAAIGNHEFNYGLPYLRRAVRQAKFPFLATNAYLPNGQHAFTNWAMIQRGGAKIGIVGATTPGSMIWDRDNLRGQLVIRDVVPEVRSAVEDVRAAGADVVLLTVHSGLDEPSSYDTVTTGVPSENVAARLAREVPGIDLILFGHSHKEVPDTVINGVLLMQPKNWATSVAIAHLGLRRENGRWRVAEKRSSIVQAADHGEDSAVVAATESAHRATLAWVTAPIGRTPVAWSADSARVADTPLIDFINEVERRVAGTDLASTAAFSLDASMDAGPITAARLQALYPYDNTLRAVRISGAQLRAYLEQSARYYVTSPTGQVSIDPGFPGFNFDIVSGVDYTLDLSKPAGQRVTKLEYQGRPVAAGDSFTLALNNYRQTGGGGYSMLSGAPVVYDKQQDIRQLLVDEVRRRGVITPADYFTRNWELVPSTAVASLYRDMHRSTRGDARAVGVSPRRDTAAVLAARPVPRLRIISTNDLHGALEPRPDASGRLRGGAAYLATAMERAKQGCVSPACEVIILDGGDEFQGTPASNLAFGRPIVQLFNELGYAAGAVGNHEFDWGQDSLRARMGEANYALLAANVRDEQGRDVPWIRDDTLVTRGALKIGVVGVATVSTPSTTRASNVSGLRFVDPVPVVDSLARQLRARGADYVVVVAHAGAFCDRDGATACNGEIIDFARALREPVDAIVSGHTHSLVDATIGGIPVIQSRSSGTAFGVTDLGPGLSSHHVYDVLPDTLAADSVTASLVKSAVAKVASLVDRPVATIATDYVRTGSEYALGNLLADAMRVEGKGDIGVMNNGGIRANLRAGPATYGSLFEIQPFGNVLYRLTVTGSALQDYLEKLVGTRPNVHVSGVAITYDSTAVPGSRIVSAKLASGASIRPDGRYTVILNDFLATGGDGLSLESGAVKSEILPLVDLDAFIAYLKSRPQPVRAPADRRLIATGPAR